MDPPRYIGRALGYTTDPTRSPDRLEALSEDEQLEMTEASEQRARDERIRRREATSAEIERELEHVRSRERYLTRQLKRLARPV